MHRINLKGPWEFQPLIASPATPSVELPGRGTVKFPAVWQDFLGDFRGRIRFLRPFNQPTNLDAHERVELVLAGLGGAAVIRLNQQAVGVISNSEHTGRFDITALLQPHNLLEIDVDWSGMSTERGGLWAPVALEIVTI
ncbi:MAG: hypothetical protein JWN70_523 [Planctomycetaceae bacterium]|nr:hypothetical protein [Planctomycetaceae bacterium]